MDDDGLNGGLPVLPIRTGRSLSHRDAIALQRVGMRYRFGLPDLDDPELRPERPRADQRVTVTA